MPDDRYPDDCFPESLCPVQSEDFLVLFQDDGGPAPCPRCQAPLHLRPGPTGYYFSCCCLRAEPRSAGARAR